jgi:hypothetical protein
MGKAFEAPSPTMPPTTDTLVSVLPPRDRAREHAARQRLALWAALALILVWGANFSVQKAVFSALSPGGFLFVRYLIMPVAAALLLCSRHGRHWPRGGRAPARARGRGWRAPTRGRCSNSGSPGICCTSSW